MFINKIVLMKYWFIILSIFVYLSCTQKKSNNTFEHTPKHFEISEEFKSEKDTTINVLWLQKTWNSELRDTLEKIMLNDIYIQTASPEAKYILAFASVLAETECWWQGEEPNTDKSNLSCLLLSALDMGCQCSKTHIDTLLYAFNSDSNIMKQIYKCTPTPYTATFQNTCEFISLQKTANNYILHLKARAFNTRNQTQTPWEKRIVFEITDSGIVSKKSIDYSIIENHL